MTTFSKAFLLFCLFQDLSEEDADRPTLEVLKELVSFFYYVYILMIL